MKVYLVRHGEVKNPDGINYGRSAGWHLSDQGRVQIAAVSQKLKFKAIKFSCIIASPMERAQETAAILSQALTLEVSTDKRLTEWDMGEWMGKPLQEFYETSGYYSTEMVTDGMEPLDDLASRVISSIQDAVTNCKAGNVIICSHREPMAAAVTKLQKLPWSEIHNIDMPIASVWELTFEEDKFMRAERFL